MAASSRRNRSCTGAELTYAGDMRAIGVVAVMVVFGCGGGGSVTSDCRAVCNTDDACFLPTDDTCVEDCVAQIHNFRPAYRDAVIDCYVGQCVKDEADCAAESLPKAPARAIDGEFREACTARRSACGGSFLDLCQTSQIFVESAVKAGLRCFAEPCSDIDLCLDIAFF